MTAVFRGSCAVIDGPQSPRRYQLKMSPPGEISHPDCRLPYQCELLAGHMHTGFVYKRWREHEWASLPAAHAAGGAGQLVLDLGEQPACDYFPRRDDPGPDPVYPLQMWLCSSCGLAQLVADPTVPEEPRGAEPAALVRAGRRRREPGRRGRAAAGGGRVAEYGSPHGGSWLGLLARRGLTPVAPGEPADVVLDCFGLMHAADQSAALAERVARVAPGGVLLLQYHSLDTIVRDGQWNALRHGHYAYYSATALTAMLAAHGFSASRAWQFELYGGTVLLAASREAGTRIAPDATRCRRCSRTTPKLVSVTRPCSAGLQRDAPGQGPGTA